MTASILLDWAFGEAVGASGSELKAFLDMREHLRRALYRGRGVAEAIVRMEAVGRWCRLYCVHDLCLFLRDAEAATEAALAKRILLALIVAEDADLRRILQDAIRDAAASSTATEVIRSLEAAAARWLSVEQPSDFSSRLDYSDVEIFVGPTVILGLAAALSQNDSTISSPSGALARLAASALSGAYGRLPFNLALEWAIASPALFDTNDVRDALLTIPSERLLTSPDIVSGLVRWTFLGPESNLRRPELLGALQLELVCLTAFRRYFGVPARAELGAAYWQDAVIALMLDIDLNAGATAVAHFWTPRVHLPEFHYRVTVPLTAIPADLATLLKKIWIPPPGEKRGEFEIQTDPGAGLASAWPVLSPWLAERSGWKAHESPHRLRWLCGLSVDIRVLESRAFDEISPFFVAHLLSSLPLLRQYANFSDHREISAWRPDVTPTGHLGWLSRNAWDSALEALSGLGRTQCRDLLFVVEDVCAPSTLLRGVHPSTVGEKLSDLRRRTTTGALRLLENAIAASTNSAWSPWLDASEAVIALHAGQIGPELKRHELSAASAPSPASKNDSAVPDDLIVYGLLRRYLTPTSTQPSFIDRRILEEVNPGQGGAGSWDVPGRRLLLAPTDEPTAWLGPGDERGAPTLHIRLARALMRVSAAHENPSLSPALAAQWRTHLDLALREITDPVQFDRFARLKLIRMAADGVFDSDGDLLILALTTLLRHGGPFHVRAVERIIVERDYAKAPQVRAGVFLALTRQNLSKRVLHADDDRVISLKNEMLEQLRAACLYADQDTQKYLANEARDLEEQTFRTEFQSITSDTMVRKDGLYSTLALNDQRDWIALATAEMVAIDATSARALVLHRPRSAPGDVNAFAGTSAHGPAKHLGIIERKRTPDRVYVRFSPSKTVMAPDVASSTKRVGDLVIVDSADANLDREMQEAAGSRKVIKLDGSDNQARLTYVSVRRTGTARPASAVAQLGTKEVDWTTGTFNFAGLQLAIGTRYRVRTRRPYGDDLGILTRTRDFADLLLDYPALGLDQTITLSLHEVSTSDVGEPASFVIEARPFERYRIYAALSLTPETRNALTEELERLRDLRFDPRGLLMTIQIASMSGSPAMRLVSEKGGTTTFDFPELACPFDHRNLVWRERFSARVQALRSDGATDVLPRSVLGMQISRRRYSTSILAPPGLPNQLDIVLEEPCKENTAFLELDPETWNPWLAEISGVVEREESLSLPMSPPDRAAAIRSIEALKSGQVISLRGVGRSIRDDGRVYGYSDANLPVFVNAETLSLSLPWDSRRGFLNAQRTAILSHFEWRASEFRILVRPGNVPTTALSRNRAKAIITRLPPIRENQVTCSVAWLDADGSGIEEASLVIQFTKTGIGRRLPQGAMIEVVLAEDVVQGRIFEPFGIADAIWHQDPELARDDAPANLVGTLKHKGVAWDVHETGAGRFALRRSEMAGARAALRRQFGLPDGQDDVAAIERTRDRPRDRIWAASGRRCALDCGALGVVAGTTTSAAIGGALRLSGMQLSMTRASRGDGWLIERRFQILKDRHQAARFQQVSDTEQVEHEDEPPRIALGDVVNGRFEPRTSTLILSGELRRSCPEGVFIPPEATQRAPVLPGVHYPGRRARAKITSLDPLVGSFTAVSESSLQDLALDLQAARPNDGSRNIDPDNLRLIFVGREEASVDTVSPVERRYVFEWGYGYWVGLEEKQVRYDGGPIQAARLLLFYGDRISAGDVAEDCLLIDSIAPSRGHVLYRQSRDHKVVNLLRVIAGSNGEPVIDAITGFDPDIERQNVGGALPYARLDPEGLRRVGPRLAEESPQRVLGRLDTQQFEESYGKTLLFNFRRLDLTDEQFGVSEGDRVFVAAGSIQKMFNDVGLVIRAPGLHSDDADPIFLPGYASQLMLRRAFSIRQQALGDILELDGADKLKDSILLVSLERRGPSLVEGALLRNSEIVRQRLRRGEEVLGVFGGGGPEKDWEIELSPGVVIGLPPNTLVQTGGFYRGDVVMMRAADGDKISLALASPSDLRFVREDRPAVVLPLDKLVRNAFPPYANLKARHSALGAFSVGDLPDLNVSARLRLPNGRIGVISDDEFASFMCQPHPKIGELHFGDGPNPENDLYFTPGVGTQTIVGRIVCDNRKAGQAPHVRVVEFDDVAAEHPSDWYLLSYADVPAADLVLPVTNGEKQFHDRRTTIWKRDADGKLSASPTRLPPMTASTGPVFFSIRSDGIATLRRPANDLIKFASGSSVLLPLLSRTQSRGRPVQVIVAEAVDDHLLVEHYPGQFLQLSSGMLQFRTLAGPLSLRALDCTQFAAGDRVILTAAEHVDSLAVVELNVSWTHGPRNAFGPYGALLDRDKVTSDAIEGIARYGIGKLTVGLPSQDVDALPVRAIVGGEQHLKIASQDVGDLLGCTVLLFIDGPDEEVRVHGVPQASFAPSQGWSWDDDSLFRGAVRGAGRSMTFHPEALLIRLRLAGGALPFTVDGCGSKGQAFLELSRRHQEVKPVGQRIIRAEVEGLIGSSRLVQLRVGGRHLALPTTALMTGIRPADESAVFTALAETQHAVWLRSHEKGFIVGYRAEGSGALTVGPCKVVKQGYQFLGVVCEGLSDGRLYWLAAKDAAAFIYSGDEAETVFSSDQMRRLKVIVLPSGAVSIMQHPSAIAEVDRLRLGASTFVDCTSVELPIPAWASPYTAPEWKLRVCVSKQTSVTFALAADPRHFERGSLQTEVAVRRDVRSGPLILLAAANERIVVSETPSWLFAAAAPPWTGAMTRFLEPSTPINGLTSVVEALEGRGDLPTAEDLIAMVRVFVTTKWVGTLSGIALCAGLKARNARAGNPAREVLVELLRNMFARSIRSAPIEVLAVWALRPPGEVSAFTASRRRQLLELFRGGRLDAARAAAERWLSAIDLEGVKPEEEALANAFGVLIGRAGKADILTREARFLSAIISATRVIGVSAEVMDETLDSATERLVQVAADLRDRQLDIPLLPPLDLFD